MQNKRNKAEARSSKKRTVLNIKYLLGGVIAGAILSPAILFSSGHVTTVTNADRLARESANKAEALAILPYCVANFRESANAIANFAALQKVNHWERGDFILEGGWATAPDGSGRGSQVANACADKLLAEAKTASEKSK
jgi:hypothetical protein